MYVVNGDMCDTGDSGPSSRCAGRSRRFSLDDGMHGTRGGTKIQGCVRGGSRERWVGRLCFRGSTMMMMSPTLPTNMPWGFGWTIRACS